MGRASALGLGLALLGSLAACRATPSETVSAATPYTGIVAVVPVNDHAASVTWYGQWIGRDADVVPMEGVAEWNLAGSAWIQVAHDPAHAGQTSVVVSVADAEAQRQACASAGVEPGALQDHGVVKLFEIEDPDGNKVVFVEASGPE